MRIKIYDVHAKVPKSMQKLDNCYCRQAKAHCSTGIEANAMAPAFEKLKSFILRSTNKDMERGELISVSLLSLLVKLNELRQGSGDTTALAGQVSIGGSGNLAIYSKI